MFYTLLALAAVLVSFGVLLYAQQPDQPRQARYESALEPVTVANVGVYSVFNIIAKEKGYFADQGLDVRVDEYDSGGPGMQALLQGRADFGVAAEYVGVVNMQNNPQLRVLSMVGRQDNFNLMARKDRGVAYPSDLRGKTVGVTKRTAGEFLLSRFLTNNGLKMEDITAVDATPDQMKAGLEDGTFDAIVIFEPHVYELERQYGDAVNSWSTQRDLKVMALLYTTQNLLDRKPEIADRFVAALVEAEKFVNANPTETQAIVARALGNDPEYLKSVWHKLQYVISFDQDVLLLMEEDARWLISTGQTNNATLPNFLQYFWFDALQKAKPDAITIVH